MRKLGTLLGEKGQGTSAIPCVCLLPKQRAGAKQWKNILIVRFFGLRESWAPVYGVEKFKPARFRSVL
jgi:hypothetical protein